MIFLTIAEIMAKPGLDARFSSLYFLFCFVFAISGVLPPLYPSLCILQIFSLVIKA